MKLNCAYIIAGLAADAQKSIQGLVIQQFLANQLGGRALV